jgi:hypothetical protein
MVPIIQGTKAKPEAMSLSEMSDVAERLRQVRAARQRFLRLWVVEQALILPGLDRIAADICGDREVRLSTTLRVSPQRWINHKSTKDAKKKENGRRNGGTR